MDRTILTFVNIRCKDTKITGFLLIFTNKYELRRIIRNQEGKNDLFFHCRILFYCLFAHLFEPLYFLIADGIIVDTEVCHVCLRQEFVTTERSSFNPAIGWCVFEYL